MWEYLDEFITRILPHPFYPGDLQRPNNFTPVNVGISGNYRRVEAGGG